MMNMIFQTTQKLILIIMLTLATKASVADEQSNPRVLLELFTSQGCYSCPAADELLKNRYFDSKDVIALEMHVDYWDNLVHGGSSWKDVFSSPLFSERQYAYARQSSKSPFTPQMVIQGAYFTSGTNQNGIDHAINEVKQLGLANKWNITFQKENGKWRASVDSTDQLPANIVSVVYLKQAKTDISRGENKGKILENHNVVTNFKDHGSLQSSSNVEIGTVPEGHDCALIIQRPPQQVVLGAWVCGAS